MHFPYFGTADVRLGSKIRTQKHLNGYTKADAYVWTHNNTEDTFTAHFKHPQWLRSSHSPTQTCEAFYLLTNLNWSCFACPMRFPFSLPPPPLLPTPPLHESSDRFHPVFCPLPASFAFLYRMSWADLSHCASAGDPEFSSNVTSQAHLSLFSSFFQPHFLLPPLYVLLQPLFFSALSVKDWGLGPAGDAEWRLWSGRKLRKVADRLLELIICSLKGRTVAQSVKQTVAIVHYK